MSEKNFFLSIKKQLPKGTFIQKIENKFFTGTKITFLPSTKIFKNINFNFNFLYTQYTVNCIYCAVYE